MDDKVGAVYQKLKGRSQKKLAKLHLNRSYVVKGGVATTNLDLNEPTNDFKLNKGSGKIRTREELLEDDDFFI